MFGLGAGPQTVAVGGLSLEGAWSSGDPRWCVPVKAGASRPPAVRLEEPELDPERSERAVRRPARRPSAGRPGAVPVVKMFDLAGGAAAGFGEAVHALFAEVEWGDAVPDETWRRRGVAADVVAEVVGCLRDPALAALWRRDDGAVVWRERAFEIVLDGAWITGVFDRVVLTRDSRGDPTHVRVLDFKTDRCSSEMEVNDAVRRHAPQLNLYRRVAAVLAGVRETAVDAEIVFTALRRRVPVRL